MSSEFDETDMKNLINAEKCGFESLHFYVTKYKGTYLRVAWPVGWCIVVSSLEGDGHFNESDLQRWETEYTCCPVKLMYIGRVRNMLSVSGCEDEDVVLLISNNGHVYCYSGWRDDCLYRAAESVTEFAKIGLRRVEFIYGDPCTATDLMTRIYVPILNLDRNWDVTRLCKIVVRNHGSVLPVAYPPLSTLRLCSLRCFESKVWCGFFMRSVRVVFGERCAPLGVVRIDSERDIAACGKATNRIPVFVTEKGVVFACDVLNREYIRLANSVTCFIHYGLRNFYGNYRCTRRGASDGDRHERSSECPLDIC